MCWNKKSPETAARPRQRKREEKDPLKIRWKYDSFRAQNHNSQLEYARCVLWPIINAGSVAGLWFPFPFPILHFDVSLEITENVLFCIYLCARLQLLFLPFYFNNKKKLILLRDTKVDLHEKKIVRCEKKIKKIKPRLDRRQIMSSCFLVRNNRAGGCYNNRGPPDRSARSNKRVQI